jgi:hypothetical protein
MSFFFVMAYMFDVIEYGHRFFVGLGSETVVKISTIRVLLI